MTSLARLERAALGDLLDEVGPGAPTLCQGWATRDLAAHLAIRERRPDAVLGYLARPLAGHAERVQRGYADLPWPRLVALLRSGPPAWSPAALRPVDAAINAIELFVHHEDVRRARAGWRPRTLPDHRQQELWRRLRTMARVLLRASPVGVALRRPDGVVWRARPGPSYVTLAGPVPELVLYAFGRTEHAEIEVLGDEADVHRLATARLGF